MRAQIKDTSWVRKSFLLPEHGIDKKYDAIRRVHSTVFYKFTDTTLGGNFAINALPQFCRYADIRHTNEYKLDPDRPRGVQASGMGRYYSEAIDDHAQIVHFRLGLPKFNSLMRFFGDFYSVEASTIARTGRAPSVFFTLGRIAGGVVTIALAPFLLMGKAIRMFIDKPASRYYYLKPTMGLYWNAVSTIVNSIAVNMGIIPRIFTDEQKQFDDGTTWTSTQVKELNNLLPGIVREDGGIDIFAISTRAQRLANSFNEALEKQMSQITSKQNMQARLRKVMSSWKPVDPARATGMDNIKSYLDKYLESADGKYDKATSPVATELDDRERTWVEKMLNFYEGERKMGADFVSFRVDHTGTNTESFSNSTKSSGIADAINSTSASARDARFNVADGNLSDGVIGTAVGGLVNSAKTFLSGVSTQLGIAGIATLAGNAFADIPEMWDSSTADVGRTTLNIPLRAPYGNDFSRLQNIIVPMAALMAMCLPLSTGKQSYTAPFILEMFNQGRTQIRLGMVESLTFTRGVGETGWLKNGRFMGVDASLTVIDLSKVVHMPIAPGFGLGRGATMLAAQGIGGAIDAATGSDGGASQAAQGVAAALMPSTYDDDNKYTDYLAVLGSLPMDAQINSWRKFKLRVTMQRAEFTAWKSPANLVQWAMGGFPGDVIKAASMATARE